MKLITVFFSLLLLPFSMAIAAPAHDHGEHQDHEEPLEGPHGGRLLESERLSLEINFYEQGVPPELRVYAYQQNKPVDPEQVELMVTLIRLDGEENIIDFAAEADYLVGDTVVEEPHSFEVVVEAQYQGSSYHWHYDNFEGRSEISDRLIKLSGIETEQAGSKTLSISNALYGVVTLPEDRQYRVQAPYPGIIESVLVKTGDKVKKGQVLVTVRNQVTLQSYSITSPANGEVTQRNANAGDHSDMGNLLQISDLSRVWIELSMFPADIEQLRVGMPIRVNDLHQHESAEATISYISPKMTAGHIARARAEIANAKGNWRPGMHINAEVMVEQYPAKLAVKRSAIQSFRDVPVVFVRYGNTFEVRMLTLGKQDADYVEVISGLKPGSEYVTTNSFLLKAEVLKAGATHDH
ncbi:efflux RND transporter periplasmic adaptor subunit [Methylophaga sp.]|uniref:efflux RND transporter periplasmic adaptor subunit n=1 Tax=Methylophaga sp. TaxID=2024840 RepID=UPI002724F773|nr:efflux RND transporter periplasmic adaptor subunit [Methylophaga sp.]MDO8825113.1 efflux RND transporter periplasmic adaptor subunit [Methylophaga sp.]